MDRNTIIGLVMIFAIFIGFTIYNQPSKEELEKIQQRRDSLALVQMKRDSARIVMDQGNLQADEDQLISDQPTQAESSEMRDKLGRFANAGMGEDKEFIIENEVMKIRISKKGGKILNVRLKDYLTYDTLPLDLFNHNNPKFGYTFFSNSRIINTSDLYFEPFYTDKKWQDKDSLFITEDDSLRFAMRLYTSNGDSLINKNQYI
jgi:YidC/Oxa1 family membrane protein insertase